ncbi:RidA family protein [Phyllobacterium sophorae]|jgi:enamine deaminase RidA (YjgF/YER057c/UK114 family)|uniref:RidA family protein n=1 Tax=Phyllobacterium sophorae TaxID=1520277 RepID=A0A2P7BI91_9HYPH|nr:RidA family protein [Phyllobacterium sophorae]PSH66183.1 RidA family protein [Phyllobacterium sophorae]
MVDHAKAPVAGAEPRLQELGITLPPPPTPLGAYVEAVTIGNLVYLSGMLAVAGRETPFVGRVGVELTVEQGRQAAEVASLNALSAVREYLGSLDKVSRVVKLGVYIATAGDFREHPIVADGASEMLVNVFGEEKLSGRIVLGVASLPLGLPIELELVLEVDA